MGTVQELGAAIREARLAKKLTKVECAAKIGVSKQFWHDAEFGRRKMTHLIEIAALLEMDVQKLHILAGDCPGCGGTGDLIDYERLCETLPKRRIVGVR